MLGKIFAFAAVGFSTFLFYANRKEYPVNNKGIVLITGASTGIGRDAAVYLSKKYPSYHVLASVRKDSDFEAIERIGSDNLKPILLDVTSDESCVKAVETIKDIMSSTGLPFVALVNNAGILRTVPVEFQDINDAKYVFDTNFFGTYRMTQLTIPLLRLSKGRIIMVSSIAGFVTTPAWSVYSASKFAMEALTDALRRELDNFGISVTSIQPGFVKSAIFESAESQTKKLMKSLPNAHLLQELYPAYYTKEHLDKLNQQMLSAPEPIVTSVAIDDALTSKFPKTRYLVSGADGASSSMISWVTWLLSDRIADSLFKSASSTASK